MSVCGEKVVNLFIIRAERAHESFCGIVCIIFLFDTVKQLVIGADEHEVRENRDGYAFVSWKFGACSADRQ